MYHAVSVVSSRRVVREDLVGGACVDDLSEARVIETRCDEGGAIYHFYSQLRAIERGKACLYLYLIGSLTHDASVY